MFGEAGGEPAGAAGIGGLLANLADAADDDVVDFRRGRGGCAGRLRSARWPSGRSGGPRTARRPGLPRPMGVRMASTMTAVGMADFPSPVVGGIVPGDGGGVKYLTEPVPPSSPRGTPLVPARVDAARVGKDFAYGNLDKQSPGPARGCKPHFAVVSKRLKMAGAQLLVRCRYSPSVVGTLHPMLSFARQAVG